MHEDAREVCKCSCGGTVWGVEDFGRLWTVCDRCTPGQTFTAPLPGRPDMHEDDLPDHAPSLFDESDALKRRRLVVLGWHQVGGTVRGRFLWRSPDTKETLDELEAFKRLEREEKSDA
jgi:hypothetical protein